MRSGSSPPVPFPNNGGGSSSPYGHPADFGPPSHIQDPARRRTTSGPQQQQQSQRSASADLSSYFPQPGGSNNVGAAAAAHARHASFSTAPQPYGSQPRQQQQQQQQRQDSRQPSPPSSEPSNGGLPPQGGGFHPYRRPERKPVPSVSAASARDSPTPSTANGSDELGRPSRPYARTADGARSDSSVSSRSSASRQQSDREQQHRQQAPPTKARGPNTPTTTADSHARGHSLSSSSASNGSISSLGAVVSPPRQQRTVTADGSGRSSVSSTPQGGSPPRAQGAQAGGKPPAKPSPLSQSQAQNEPVRQPAVTPAVQKLAAAPVTAAPAAAPEKVKKGFMGKLKGKGKPPSTEPGSKANPLIRNVSGPATVGEPTTGSSADGPPLSPDDATFVAAGDEPGKRGGLKRTRSLFNMKNASTDNISIASAASSASMMIRKIGSFGKLASRNRCVAPGRLPDRASPCVVADLLATPTRSISGISNIFKDKKSKDLDDLDGGAEKKKGGLSAFRSRKTAPSAAATARASAELDRQAAVTASGLTPAARLARQHTIKSKAAEEAEEERRRSTIGDVVTEDGRRPSLDVPTAWESTTATSQTNGRQPVQLVDDGFSDSEDEDDSRSLDVDDVADRLAGAGIDDHAGDEAGEYADWGTYPVSVPPAAPRSILKRMSRQLCVSAEGHL